MPEPSVPTLAYRAFISYSHRDQAWAGWLHKALETWRVPARLVGTATAHGKIPRRLIPIFRDRDDLSSAPELGARINAALRRSETLIVLCSPASAASRWVNEEVLAYKRMGRGDRILCLIVGGEPNASGLPGREGEECFCPALRFRLDAKGQPTTERTEPIAADVRSGMDSKANAKLRLIAGMLDVDFDVLKQREQHRKVRRLTVITAIAVCVMAVTIALAVFALISRHRAVISKREAVVAQHTAQQRQRQAEDLVNFMLGDLNDKLQEVNRLDIMQTVDDKAMAYFKSLPNRDVNVVELAQRARALEKIGSVRLQQGELAGALAAYRASTRISSRLAAANPLDIARHVAYSRTLAFIGLVYWNQGNLAAAQQAFETGRRVLRDAAAKARGDAAVLYQLQTLDNNIGHVLEARGELAAAGSGYRNTLVVSEELANLKPHDSDVVSQVGDAHSNLGRLALERGDLASAIAQYQADDTIQTRLSERDPRDNGQREQLVRTRGILGRTLALAGDVQGSTRALQQAVDIAVELVKVDPGDTNFQDDLAIYSAQLARLLRLNGDMAHARVLTSRAIQILSGLIRKDPSNSGWQSDMAEALIEQAAESAAAGERPAASAEVQGALRTLDPMLAEHPDDHNILLSTMTARLLLADVGTEPGIAQALRREALQTMQAQQAGRSDPRLLALRAEAMLAPGRPANARSLVKRLWASGYRDAGLLLTLQRAHIDYPPNPDFQARLLAATRADGDAASNAGKDARRQ